MIEHVVQRIREWEHLGTIVAIDGSRLVAHTPRDYPQAYLHRLFAPVPESAWKGFPVPLPGQLEQLYRECNGLSIFAGSLSLWGIRMHYVRDVSAQFQPFDLATHNSECINGFHRGALSDAEGVFFGGYVEDGSHVFTARSAPHVHRLLRGTARIVNSWPDVATFLATEYDRIDQLFSRAGYLLNDKASTAPKAA